MGITEWSGVAFTFLVLGILVILQFPTRWQTWPVYLIISFVGIPAFLLIAGAMIAYPPLFVLMLIVAFAGANPGR